MDTKFLEILERAGTVFMRYGVRSVTMDDIASNSGVSKKTIYAHFSNKTDLVEAVTNYIFDLWMEAILRQPLNPLV